MTRKKRAILSVIFLIVVLALCLAVASVDPEQRAERSAARATEQYGREVFQTQVEAIDQATQTAESGGGQ